MLNRFSRVRLCATPWTAAHQAPLSAGISKQNSWSGLPYIRNLEKRYWWTYLENKNRDTDLENEHVDSGVREGESGTNWEASACQGMFDSKSPVCCFLSLWSPLFRISPCQGPEEQASFSLDGAQRHGMLAWDFLHKLFRLVKGVIYNSLPRPHLFLLVGS